MVLVNNFATSHLFRPRQSQHFPPKSG